MTARDHAIRDRAVAPNGASRATGYAIGRQHGGGAIYGDGDGADGTGNGGGIDNDDLGDGAGLGSVAIGLATADGIGAQLRAARERAGLSIDAVAAETRISRRYLENIDRGDFSELPGRTYAIGFSKTYARLVGLDESDVAAMVGAELDAHKPAAPPRAKPFEPGDPARVPSARLGVISLMALALLLAGLFFVARLMFAPAAELPSLVDQQEAKQTQRQAALAADAAPGQARPEAPATPVGPVVFTALDQGIWVKFYDADGMELMQKFMDRGERYTVPADARGPQLWTGRPDALAISVGGRDVPRLANETRIMRDIPVTAQALLVRATPTAGTSDQASPRPDQTAPAPPAAT